MFVLRHRRRARDGGVAHHQAVDAEAQRQALGTKQQRMIVFIAYQAFKASKYTGTLVTLTDLMCNEAVAIKGCTVSAC